MKERPILFSTPMVQAILAGRKKQTRRIIKHFGNLPHYGKLLCHWGLSDDPYIDDKGRLIWTLQTAVDDSQTFYIKLKYNIGDVLWVREAFAMSFDTEDHPELENNQQEYWETGYVYKADGKPFYQIDRWKPSIHMPRNAARIFLKVTNIRVEKVQDISENDAISEGVYCYSDEGDDEAYKNYLHEPDNADDWGLMTARASFKTLWQKINGELSWNDNPWIWVYEFEITTQ